MKGGFYTKILSLDQALSVTGYAIFEDEKLIKSGILSVKKGSSEFYSMPLQLTELIETVKPDYVVFEDTMFQKNVGTLKKLSRLQGVIIIACIKGKIPYRMYMPAQWRKIVGIQTGKGIKREELKKMAQEKVYENHTVKAAEDESEAICIGEALITDMQS